MSSKSDKTEIIHKDSGKINELFLHVGWIPFHFLTCAIFLPRSAYLVNISYNIFLIWP